MSICKDKMSAIVPHSFVLSSVECRDASICKEPVDVPYISSWQQPKSSLKRSASQMIPDICPLKVDPRMDTNDEYDPSSKCTSVDYSPRREAIKNYILRETGTDYPAKKPRCTFLQSGVIHFELLEGSPLASECVEAVKFTDPCEPFAARALCRIISRAEKLLLPQVNDLFIEEAVRQVQAINNEQTTVKEMTVLVLEQANDLADRCEERLSCLPKDPQFDYRRAMKEGVAEDGPWDPEDEAAYEEKLLTRIPDALTQRFLKYRVGSRVVGLDATARTLRILREVVLPSLQ